MVQFLISLGILFINLFFLFTCMLIHTLLAHQDITFLTADHVTLMHSQVIHTDLTVRVLTRTAPLGVRATQSPINSFGYTIRVIAYRASTVRAGILCYFTTRALLLGHGGY